MTLLKTLVYLGKAARKLEVRTMSEVKKCPCGVPLDSNLGPKWRCKKKYCSYACRAKYGNKARQDTKPEAVEAVTIANRFINEIGRASCRERV